MFIGARTPDAGSLTKAQKPRFSQACSSGSQRWGAVEARTGCRSAARRAGLSEMESRKSERPLQEERGCTNVEWLLLFAVHLVIFLSTVFAGAGHGNPWKLFSTRDFRGDYCGFDTDANRFATRSYADHPSAIFMMNVSGALQAMAEDLICSSYARQELVTLLNADELAQYECGCCLSPCDSCSSALDLEVFISLDSLTANIQDRMLDLTDASRASLLHLGTGANKGEFLSIFQVSTIWQYLTQVCVKDCKAWDHVGNRPYTYEPLPDLGWAPAWRKLRSEGSTAFTQAMGEYMRLDAVPENICPYDAEYCVPFPGLVFDSLAATSFCFPYIPEDISNGNTVASFVEETTWSLGEGFGLVLGTVDVFIINAVLAFVVGVIFIVLVRLLVFWVVWGSFFLVFVMILIPGIFVFLEAEKCAGSSTASTAILYAESAVVLASTSSGLQTDSGDESMSGDGSDYRGAQTRTISGAQCQEWAVQEPHPHSFTPSNYPSAGLDSNYCRNPDGVASSIWCYTVDAGKSWDLCNPLDAALAGRCPNGYKHSVTWQRTVMRLLGAVLCVLALIWLCSIWCLRSRISLAIEVFKEAGTFIIESPTILAVPGLQTFFAVAWFCVWGLLVGFMLSQVPNDYNSDGYFKTYSEAHSECIASKSSAGWLWRDHGDLTSSSNPCSGSSGDILGIETACWRCALPRNIFDARMFWALFTFYWVGELICAMETFIIASGCVHWALQADPGHSALRVGLWWVFRYHFGSLAFGSCILAVVKTLRDICNYFRHKAQAEMNKTMECVCGCLACCISCFERFLEYVSEKAYIQIAIEGDPFCTAALDAFKLLASNFVRYGVIDIIGAVIFRIGVCSITAVSVFFSYLVLTGMTTGEQVILPMVFYFAMSVVVAEVYMNVYRTASDTMLQVTILAEAGKLPKGSNPRALLQRYLESAESSGLAYDLVKPSQSHMLEAKE